MYSQTKSYKWCLKSSLPWYTYLIFALSFGRKIKWEVSEEILGELLDRLTLDLWITTYFFATIATVWITLMHRVCLGYFVWIQETNSITMKSMTCLSQLTRVKYCNSLLPGIQKGGRMWFISSFQGYTASLMCGSHNHRGTYQNQCKNCLASISEWGLIKHPDIYRKPECKVLKSTQCTYPQVCPKLGFLGYLALSNSARHLCGSEEQLEPPCCCLQYLVLKCLLHV